MAIEHTPQYSQLATVTNAGTFAVQVTTMPGITVEAATVSNLASVPLTVSGTTIAITSIGTMPNISVEAATVSNLASVPLTISGTTIAITSLPPLAVGSSVTVSNLAATPLTVSTTAGATTPHSGYFHFSSTYVAAQLTTGTVLVAEGASTTSIHITDIHFSNNSTQGNMALYDSSTSGFVQVVPDTYFMDKGGMVSNLGTPIVLETNAALLMVSQTCTSHSVMVSGYIA